MRDFVGGERGPAWSLLLVLLLATLDLAATITGIRDGLGVEANPFYAPFTHWGVLGMLIGLSIYLAAVLLVYRLLAVGWWAIVVGALTADHLLGFLSWARYLHLPLAGLVFHSQFLRLLLPGLLAAMAAVLTYLTRSSQRQRPVVVTWLDGGPRA